MFKSWFSFVLFFLEHNERITLVLKNMEGISMEYDAWFCSHLMESSNSFSVVGTYRISCSLNVAAKYEQEDCLFNISRMEGTGFASKSLQISNYFRALCFLFKWQKMDEYLFSWSFSGMVMHLNRMYFQGSFNPLCL